MVLGLPFRRAREAQSLYTDRSHYDEHYSARPTERSHVSLPERIPVERVSFDLAPTYRRTSSAMSHHRSTRRRFQFLERKALPGPFSAFTYQAGREIRQEAT